MCEPPTNIVLTNVNTLRPVRPHSTIETHRGVDARLQAELIDQRGCQQEPGVREQVVAFEGRVNPVEGL